MQRVELIQDLRFETATTKIKATPDGEFIIASGSSSLPYIYFLLTASDIMSNFLAAINTYYSLIFILLS